MAAILPLADAVDARAVPDPRARARALNADAPLAAPMVAPDGKAEPKVGMALGSLAGAAWALTRRDLRLASRRRTDTLAGLAFFIMASSLFPLALGPEPGLLARVASGVAWVVALLASLLPLARLFEDDLADGTLEQLLLSPHPLALLVLGKVTAHWLTSGLPLALIAPLIALQYGLPTEGLLALLASLLLGTPILSLIGAVAAALATGLRGGALLLSLMVLPLSVPVLVFGCGAVDAVLAGQSPAGAFSLLGAGLLLALAGAPAASAAALRISVEA